jgi:hypothetical protein
VLAVYVVERPVEGLGNHRQAPVLVLIGARLELGGYESVAHYTDAVGVGDRDRGGQHTGLADPLEAGHLPVAVQAVRACEDGVVPGQALAGADDGHARPHRSFADHERTLPPHYGRVSDAHALNVGDRAVRAGRQVSDLYPRITRAHALLSHGTPPLSRLAPGLFRLVRTFPRYC